MANFNGKYESPRKPTTEETLSTITEAVDVRLKELTDQTRKMKIELEAANKDYTTIINLNSKLIADMLSEIGKKIKKNE